MRVLKINVLAWMVLFLVVGVSYAQTAEEYYNKGMEYGAQGKFKEAEEEFKKALQIDQFCPPAQMCLKIIEDVLEKRVEDEAATHLFKGGAYGKKEMFDEAIAEFKKAIAINPNYAKAHSNQYNFEVAYAKKGMFDEAITEFKKAIAINPNYAEVHNNLAVIYYYKGQYGLAIEHCDRAIELGYSVDFFLLEDLKPYRK